MAKAHLALFSILFFSNFSLESALSQCYPGLGDCGNPTPEGKPPIKSPSHGQKECGWFTILYCSRDIENARATSAKLGARVIDTSSTQYPAFRAGWFCSGFGPIEKQDAQDLADRFLSQYPTAYIKNSC